MKKILSIALALCMLLTILPMSVSAATGDALANGNFSTAWNDEFVSVEAGATAYFEMGYYDPGEYNFSVTGTGDFTVAPCGLGTDTWYTEGTPVAAVDGVANAVLLVSDGANDNGGYGGFSITNNSTESADYLVTIELPIGTQNNPDSVSIALDGTATVTVPSGANYYVAVTLPETGKEYQLTITGETGFGLSSGWGMPTWDTNGTIITTASAWWGPYSMCLVNNTATEQTYTLLLSNMPVGTSANPDAAVVGSNVANITNTEYYYTWVAEQDSIVTVAMDEINRNNPTNIRPERL